MPRMTFVDIGGARRETIGNPVSLRNRRFSSAMAILPVIIAPDPWLKVKSDPVERIGELVRLLAVELGPGQHVPSPALHSPSCVTMSPEGK